MYSSQTCSCVTMLFCITVSVCLNSVHYDNILIQLISRTHMVRYLIEFPCSMSSSTHVWINCTTKYRGVNTKVLYLLLYSIALRTLLHSHIKLLTILITIIMSQLA